MIVIVIWQENESAVWRQVINGHGKYIYSQSETIKRRETTFKEGKMGES